jgi:hypothetical protein
VPTRDHEHLDRLDLDLDHEHEWNHDDQAPDHHDAEVGRSFDLTKSFLSSAEVLIAHKAVVPEQVRIE